MPLDFNDKTDFAKWTRQQPMPNKISLLASCTGAGILPDLSSPRSTDLTGVISKASTINWSQTYAVAKATLANELSLALKSGNAHRSAQLEVATEELELLNGSSANVRTPVIQGFRHNEQKFAKLRQDAYTVYKSYDVTGVNLFTTPNQEIVIADVDGIDAKPLQVELHCIEKALSAQTDAKIKMQLENEKNDLLSTMTAPFVERCRAAALRDNSKDPHQAETYLQDAMQKISSVPAEAWQLESNRKFRNDMTAEYKELHVLNNLPEEFNANLPKLDLIDHNGAVTQAELKAAEAKHDPALTPLINVLNQYYDNLTEKHSPGSKDGITIDDVNALALSRQKRPNDVRY